MRYFLSILCLWVVAVSSHALSTNQAVTEVSALYPGKVLSADGDLPVQGVQVRLLSPAGLVQKLLVCEHDALITVKEITLENSGSRRPTCDSHATKD